MYVKKLSAPGDGTSTWESWLSEGEIVPVFQPIFSVDSRELYGFEALGRLYSNFEFHSLGPFFKTDSGGGLAANDFDSMQRRVDRQIREQALRIFSSSAFRNTQIFLNISPRLMLAHLQENAEGLPLTLRMAEEVGLESERIVIEMTEQNVYEDLNSLSEIIRKYRDAGCLLAIDDVGSEASNLDRIGFFQPDIIKIDLSLLRQSLTQRSFHEILHHLSRVAESLGSALLFEGIETKYEYMQALEYGARYVQGYYFARPNSVLEDSPDVPLLLKQGLEDFCGRKSQRLKQRLLWEEDMLSRLAKLKFEFALLHGLVTMDTGDLVAFKDFVQRIYLTNNFGYQVSPNYYFQNEACETDFSLIGRNWSHRPYFFDHLTRGHKRSHGWNISDPYVDIHNKQILRTFSRKFNRDFILFVDICSEMSL